MNEFEEQEKEIKKQFATIKCKSFDERFAEIVSWLIKKPKQKSKRKPFKTLHILAMAASLMLLIGGGFTVYFVTRDNGNEEGPRYSYTDEYIKFESCDESDLMSFNDLHLPDLSMLIEKTFNVGKHKETEEIVYFQGIGIAINELSFRELEFTIILVKDYTKDNEEEYLNLPNSCTVGGIEISYSQPVSEEIFYGYKVSFKIGDVRYYFNYKTIEEDDIAVFFEEFL